MDARGGKFLAGVRADLMRHVGGAPNTVSDSATTAGASLANQIATLTRVVGACAIDQPCLNSVVGVPGTGRTFSVSYV
jgi:hypothetical protein